MTCRLILFYISTKYHQNITKGIWVTARIQNLFQTKQREITPKVRKPELLFLYMTRCLVPFYISTMYHKNIPKGIQVSEQTRTFTAMLTPMGCIPKTIWPPPFGRSGAGVEVGGEGHKYSAEDTLKYCSYFSQKTGLNISNGDNLHEISNPIFLEK